MKIAIIRLSSFGDIIHSLWTTQFIKNKFRNSEITWICDSSFEELVKCCPFVDRIIAIPLRKRKYHESFRILRTLSEERFDFIIDMQGLFKSALVSRILSKEIHGFSKKSCRESLASFFYSEKHEISYKKNIYTRNLELVQKALGFSAEPDNYTEYLKYLKCNLKKTYFPDNRKKNIIFIPGATTPERVIPSEKYAEIISGLEYNCHIIYGNQDELEKCEQIKKLCPDLIILPKLSVSELIGYFEKSNCVIGPDTGPANIPFAVRRPSITIYWDGARNSYKRNTAHTEINKAISFPDLSKIDTSLIISHIIRLTEKS